MNRFIKMALVAVLIASVNAGSGFCSQDNEGETEKAWTLEDCLEYGLASHPEIKSAKSSVQMQKASVMSAKSNYDLSLNGSVSFSANGADRISRKHEESKSESLSISQRIFDIKSTLQKKIANENLKSAQKQYDSKLIDQAVKIKAAYFKAQQKRAVLKVRMETLERYERHLNKVESFVEVGTYAPFDITKAQVDVANARVSLISAKNDLKNALIAVAQAIGMEGSINLAPYTNTELPKFDVSDFQALVKEAMERPDVKSKEASLKAADYSLEKAKNNLMPSVSASGGYSWRGANTPQNRGWDAGLSINLPIFDGRNTKALVMSAKGSKLNSEASLESLKLSVYNELETAVADFTDAIERHEANKILVKNASESLELAEARYNVGMGSIIELSDAQVDYAKARADLIVSYYDSLIAANTIDKALGRIPEEYKKN